MEKIHPILLIYVSEITPRIEYTFELIFNTILGTELTFTTKPGEFTASKLPRINYSATNHLSGLFLKAHPLLSEQNITVQDTAEVEYKDTPLFFPTSEDSFLPFDPFACAFYLLTRYEEYHSEITDEHERFPDPNNILVLRHMHQKPLVDQMAYWLAEKVTEAFPGFKIRERSFQFKTTIDIDNAWAFKNKSISVGLGAAVKALASRQWDELKARLEVFLRLKKDPYDTYKYITETYKGFMDHILFFFLLGDRNKYDKNISHKNKGFRELIDSLATVCEVGIHPSYVSNRKPWMLEKEKNRLEDIIQKPVTNSRQHFLKLKIPDTYQRLRKSGITDDYTMGFAKLSGFRAGTCTAFPFFDLSCNRQTQLIINPFQIMDVSLKYHLDMSPESALQHIEELMGEVKKVNGTFISIWHNESLKDSGQWLGWRMVFEQIMLTGLNYENEQS